MRGRSPRGWLFTEVYVALRSLVRQRMTVAMHAADRIHHKSMPLPQASELCFQCIPTPTPPVCSKGSRALLEGAASLEGSPVGRLAAHRSHSLWEHHLV